MTFIRLLASSLTVRQYESFILCEIKRKKTAEDYSGLATAKGEKLIIITINLI